MVTRHTTSRRETLRDVTTKPSLKHRAPARVQLLGNGQKVRLAHGATQVLAAIKLPAEIEIDLIDANGQMF
jgi:hypothetical protein